MPNWYIHLYVFARKNHDYLPFNVDDIGDAKGAVNELTKRIQKATKHGDRIVMFRKTGPGRGHAIILQGVTKRGPGGKPAMVVSDPLFVSEPKKQFLYYDLEDFQRNILRPSISFVGRGSRTVALWRVPRHQSLVAK